jgi:tetratricopeptide (TPR) repeat protein
VKISSLTKYAVYTVSCLSATTGHTCVFAANVSTPTAEAYSNANFRLSFELKTPRRFASRFQKATRTLEVRVTPAQAKEFESSTYYDTRFVHRLVIREEAGEVILGLQLKNESMGWLVTYQENPWRLVVDIWRTNAAPQRSLEEQWQWQGDNVGEHLSQKNTKSREVDIPMTTEMGSANAPASNHPVKPVAIPAAQKPPSAAYGRLEELVAQSNTRIEELQRLSGEAMGAPNEFSRVNDLANALYLSGRSEQALVAFRRLASLSEMKFRENPENLWRAGESSFLTGRYELASDYLRTLMALYPDTGAGSQARLRLADIDIVAANDSPEKAKANAIAATYADIALNEKSSMAAKITATVRILNTKIDANPEAASLYQNNLSACVGKNIVPFEMRKDCSYIKTRGIIEKIDLNSADREVQDFKKFASQDPRWQLLNARIIARVRDLLVDCQQKKTWDTWIEFEQNARPQILDFTRGETNLLMARANAWETAGDMKNAAKLYGLAFDSQVDRSTKDNAAAHAALVLSKSGKAQAAAKYLTAIEKSPARKENGFTPDTLETLRALAHAPFRNKTALRVLVGEMANARFVERDLPTLLGFAALLRKTREVDTVYEKIIAFPAKGNDETKGIEKALFQYSDDLLHTGKSQKSAEILASVANLQNGTRRAEAAYKAGIAYARAGQLEKAKTIWQLAASDVSDKRFSTLANERLDRMR